MGIKVEYIFKIDKLGREYALRRVKGKSTRISVKLAKKRDKANKRSRIRREELKKAKSHGLELSDVNKQAKHYTKQVQDGKLSIGKNIDKYPEEKLFNYFKQRIMNESGYMVRLKYKILYHITSVYNTPIIDAGNRKGKTMNDFKYLIKYINDKIRKINVERNGTILPEISGVCLRYYKILFNPIKGTRMEFKDIVPPYQLYMGCLRV